MVIMLLFVKTEERVTEIKQAMGFAINIRRAVIWYPIATGPKDWSGAPAAVDSSSCIHLEARISIQHKQQHILAKAKGKRKNYEQVLDLLLLHRVIE